MIPHRKIVYWFLLPALVVMLLGMELAYSQEQGVPDLVISSITYTPLVPAPPDWITVIVTVKNDGASSSPASTAWLQFNEEKHPTTHNIPALEPGETFQFQRVDKILSYGKHYITAIADWEEVP